MTGYGVGAYGTSYGSRDTLTRPISRRVYRVSRTFRITDDQRPRRDLLRERRRADAVRRIGRVNRPWESYITADSRMADLG